MSDTPEATVYVNGVMQTRPLIVDHVMDGTTAYGRIWVDHRLSLELSKADLARLIEELAELEL
jgi:hypothetical protein